MTLIEAHILAHEIERVSAGREAAARNGHGRPRHSWKDCFDPLAATTLGDLIYSRATGKGRQ